MCCELNKLKDRKMKINMKIEVGNLDSYRSDDGMVLARENGLTPNGNNMNWRWVLRDSKKSMIDYSQYRNDLAERHCLDLK